MRSPEDKKANGGKLRRGAPKAGKSRASTTAASTPVLKPVPSGRKAPRDDPWTPERRLSVLNDVFHVFLTVPDDEIYAEVLAVILPALHSRFGFFGFIDAKGDLVAPSLTRDVWTDCQVSDKSIVFPRATWGNAIWARAILEKKALSSDGPFNIPQGHIRLKNVLVAPIVFGRKVIGELAVADSDSGFSGQDLNMLTLVANRISPVLKARQQLDRDEENRKRMEGDLLRLNRELKALGSCNEAMLRANDEQSLLESVCRIICEDAGYRMAWAGYAGMDADKSILPVAHAGFENGYFSEAPLRWSDKTEFGRGPTGTAIRTGKTCYVQDLGLDPCMAPWREAALDRGYRSIISLPLKAERGAVFGALSIYSDAVNAFTEEEVRLLEDLGADLAFGIAALRTRAEQRKNEEINESRLRLIAYSGSHDLDALLEETLNEAEKLTGSLIGFYHFIADDQDTLTLQNWSTRTKVEFCRIPEKRSHRSLTDAGVWADSIRLGRPVMINDYVSFANKKGVPEGHAGIVRVLSVPVMRDGKVMSVLGVGNKAADYTKEDVDAVARLADLAWEIAERKRAVDALRESEKQVRRKLEAILSPDTDVSALDLVDILDSENIGRLMEKFYRLTGIGIAIEDLEGRPLVGIGWQDICTQFHRANPETSRLCLESDIELSGDIPPDQFKINRCKNNMWDMATPIMIGGRHMGSVFFGQFFFEGEEPDLEVFRRQAAKYGFDEKEYLEALRRVPRFSREKVEAVMSFNSALAATIGDLSYGNIKLASSLEKHRRDGKLLLESVARLRTTMREAINALSAAVELRDPYTAGHQERVTRLAVAMAREMGIADERIEGIQVAGVVHDIGKIQIPAEILNKPSRLMPLEYRMVKEHAEAGYKILKNIEFPWPVAEMVRQHHERLDGTGYPRGLKGGEMIIEARILAVADTVEAMSSHRPYRPALGTDKALAEIEQGRGTLYDTEAVDACLRLFREKGFQF